MTMGLEPMNPLDWIEIDECYEEELALRKELIENNRSIVIHSLPGVGHLLKGLAVCFRESAKMWTCCHQCTQAKNSTECWIFSLAPPSMRQGARAYNA